MSRNREIGERQQQDAPQRETPPRQVPTSLEDVLQEVIRETQKRQTYTEVNTPPPPPPPPPPPYQKPNPFERKKQEQKFPVPQPYSQPKKKPASPFLTTDYSPEPYEKPKKILDTIEAEGTPSTLMQDVIAQSQLTDAGVKRRPSIRSRFNGREAMIAKIILDRPQW